eukprot:Gb_25997 [translate_table: standard]
MVKFGKNNLIATDSTFGTNKLKYPLFTLLVFDTHQNGLLVAWIISSSSSASDIQSWMEKLRSRVYEMDPTWRPSAFMVDDTAAEINAISDVFGCHILLCLWHVRRSWLKNLTKKCHDYMVDEKCKDLGDIIYNQSYATNLMETIECFIHKYRDQTFLIILENWMHRMDVWVKAIRRLPHSNQETNGAIEAYNDTLKDRLSREA